MAKNIGKAKMLRHFDFAYFHCDAAPTGASVRHKWGGSYR